MEDPREVNDCLSRVAGGVAPALQTRDKKPRVGGEGAPILLPEVSAEEDYDALERGEWPFDDDPPDPL